MATPVTTLLQPLHNTACKSFNRAMTTSKTLLVALLVACGLSWANGHAYADQPIVVEDDFGGSVQERMRDIEKLLTSAQSVEIRGANCFSSCTMLLGLAQTCISPATVFGFHGPSRNGERMKEDEFEKYSRLIASYYPKPLRDWYMRKGRHRIKGIHRISGARIIRMGVKACRL